MSQHKITAVLEKQTVNNETKFGDSHQLLESFCCPRQIPINMKTTWAKIKENRIEPSRPQASVTFFFFNLILVTAIGGRPIEFCFLFLSGRLRWTLLPKQRYGDSLSGLGHSVAVVKHPSFQLRGGRFNTELSSVIVKSVTLPWLTWTPKCNQSNGGEIICPPPNNAARERPNQSEKPTTVCDGYFQHVVWAECGFSTATSALAHGKRKPTVSLTNCWFLTRQG